MGLNSPDKITNNEYRFDAFSNGKVLLNKKKNRLPAMGWNSWNAFGTGNNEALTKAMADCFIKLGLDKLGYKYIILDDGCYKSKRSDDGKLMNDEVKFPSGFLALADYIHSKGLKFGMYNDIGTKLCSGLEVGTCGHEKTDAASYVSWKIDFLKVDNCYYLWDNATFSNPENAKYVYAPYIKEVSVKGCEITGQKTVGQGIVFENGTYKNIGTFDGTNTGTSPNGPRSGEIEYSINAPEKGSYTLLVKYEAGCEIGKGSWLQIALGRGKDALYYFDDLLDSSTDLKEGTLKIEIELKEGQNILRLMNHRRQENTLCSYAAMLEGLNEANPDNEIILSLCEWGKTQPQNWGYKVADSWRILNDITFRVGSDGDAGYGQWSDPGTPSVTSQYNKAVVMDEYAGLDKGWNDPDMLMIGMKGLTPVMNQSHFTMWCMMNAPLLLGLDLRRVEVGNEIYKIIANKDLIDLNQDKLGIQAKRIYTSAKIDESLGESADKKYITDNERFDILAKPLADGSLALSVFNLSQENPSSEFILKSALIKQKLGAKCPLAFNGASKFIVKNLWTGKLEEVKGEEFILPSLEPCGNFTVKISPAE